MCITQSAGLLLRITILVYIHSHLECPRVPELLHPIYSTWHLYPFLFYYPLIGERWFLVIAVICISLIIDEFELLFIIHSLAI